MGELRRIKLKHLADEPLLCGDFFDLLLVSDCMRDFQVVVVNSCCEMPLWFTCACDQDWIKVELADWNHDLALDYIIPLGVSFLRMQKPHAVVLSISDPLSCLGCRDLEVAVPVIAIHGLQPLRSAEAVVGIFVLYQSTRVFTHLN